MPEPMKGLISATAVAVVLQVTRVRVYQLVDEGKLHPIRTPLGLAFREVEVLKLAEVYALKRSKGAKKKEHLGISAKIQEQVQGLREKEEQS